jgi:hypothetical protein
MPIKPVILFCLKSAVFTAIFWGVWLGVVRPITNPSKPHSSSSQDAQAQAEAYNNQVARVNHQLEVVEAQQQRMEKYLTAQEENTKRYDAVLKVWEKQTGLRK